MKLNDFDHQSEEMLNKRCGRAMKGFRVENLQQIDHLSYQFGFHPIKILIQQLKKHYNINKLVASICLNSDPIVYLLEKQINV